MSARQRTCCRIDLRVSSRLRGEFSVFNTQRPIEYRYIGIRLFNMEGSPRRPLPLSVVRWSISPSVRSSTVENLVVTSEDPLEFILFNTLVPQAHSGRLRRLHIPQRFHSWLRLLTVDVNMSSGTLNYDGPSSCAPEPTKLRLAHTSFDRAHVFDTRGNLHTVGRSGWDAAIAESPRTDSHLQGHPRSVDILECIW